MSYIEFMSYIELMILRNSRELLNIKECRNSASTCPVVAYKNRFPKEHISPFWNCDKCWTLFNYKPKLAVFRNFQQCPCGRHSNKIIIEVLDEYLEKLKADLPEEEKE